MSGLFDTATPEKRERFLIGIMVFVVIVIVLPMLFNLFGTKLTVARKKRDQLVKEVNTLQAEMRTADAISRQLLEMNEAALPSDDVYARRVYQQWLTGLAQDAGLEMRSIDASSVTPIRFKKQELYKRYSCTLHARGALAQLADFLRCLEHSGYLQLVRRVDSKPIVNSNKMDLTITIEALSLPQSERRSLPPIARGQLDASESERAMMKRIADRALFSIYTPPRPDSSRTENNQPAQFDHSPYCFVTAITETNGKKQVRVNIRSEDKVYWLGPEDSFQLGDVRCYVRAIDFDRVRIEAAGEMFTVKLGKSFAEYEI